MSFCMMWEIKLHSFYPVYISYCAKVSDTCCLCIVCVCFPLHSPAKQEWIVHCFFVCQFVVSDGQYIINYSTQVEYLKDGN